MPHPYAFNLFSHNAELDPVSGYNGEELKVVAETRGILGIPALSISHYLRAGAYFAERLLAPR